MGIIYLFEGKRGTGKTTKIIEILKKNNILGKEKIIIYYEYCKYDNLLYKKLFKNISVKDYLYLNFYNLIEFKDRKEFFNKNKIYKNTIIILDINYLFINEKQYLFNFIKENLFYNKIILSLRKDHNHSIFNYLFGPYENKIYNHRLNDFKIF